MRAVNPPRIATWALHHLAGEGNDALAGDLLEEFRSGRSAEWYWRQVLACIAISNKRVVLANISALLFAGLWALLAPAWLPITRMGEFPRLDHTFLSLAWPWSTLCVLMLTFFLLISFVWAGLLLFLLLESLTSSRFNFRHLRRGIMRSAAVFTPLWMATWTLLLIFPGFGIRIPRLAHDPFALFLLSKPAFCVICAPFFLTLLWAMWDTSHQSKNPDRTQ